MVTYFSSTGSFALLLGVVPLATEPAGVVLVLALPLLLLLSSKR